jgi:hypothetical protein
VVTEPNLDFDDESADRAHDRVDEKRRAREAVDGG